MRNKSICLFMFLVLFVCVFAQNDDVEKRLVKKIMEELVDDLETATEVNLIEPTYYVAVGEEYEKVIMYVHILACDDLNGDGIPDYVGRQCKYECRLPGLYYEREW